jgi:hypothetical protein
VRGSSEIFLGGDREKADFALDGICNGDAGEGVDATGVGGVGLFLFTFMSR